MAILANFTHDDGTFNEYDNPGTISSGFTVISAAGMGGTAYGVKVDHDGDFSIPPSYNYSGFSGVSSNARLGFRFRKNTIAIASSNDGCWLLEWNNPAGSAEMAIFTLEKDGLGNLIIKCEVDLDGAGTAILISNSITTTAEFTVEVHIIRASSSIASDGEAHLYIAGVEEDTALGLDNYDDWTKYNSAGGIDVKADEFGGITGSLYIDEIMLRDDSSPIFGASFRLLGLAADSGHLYATGLEDGATLKLYDYALANLAEGASPSAFGSGTNAEIAAACRGVFPVVRPGAACYLYLYGRDGNNVQVQKNDMSNASGWQNIGAGSATWDASKMAVGILPDILGSNDLIAVFTDGQIWRTLSEGTSWAQQGTGVGGSLLAAARHPIDDNKLFLGGSVQGRLNYSHNYGISSNAIDIPGGSASAINHIEVSL